jgi:hypothetical protein
LSYKFADDQQKPTIWPKRVQILFDDYIAAGKAAGVTLSYQPETIDLYEKIFDDRARDKPESLKVSINAVYRVKNLRNEEFYYYAASKSCNNALNRPAEPFSYQYYGYHRSPIVTMRWNEIRNFSEPNVSTYKHGFELVWNKDNVKQLLDSSYLPCQLFYIGNVGNDSLEPIASRYYQIQNMTDFLEGTHEDLMALGRFGLSSPEPSLYLLETARKEEKERRKEEAGKRVRSQTSLTS